MVSPVMGCLEGVFVKGTVPALDLVDCYERVLNNALLAALKKPFNAAAIFVLGVNHNHNRKDVQTALR